MFLKINFEFLDKAWYFINLIKYNLLHLLRGGFINSYYLRECFSRSMYFLILF